MVDEVVWMTDTGSRMPDDEWRMMNDGMCMMMLIMMDDVDDDDSNNDDDGDGDHDCDGV